MHTTFFLIIRCLLYFVQTDTEVQLSRYKVLLDYIIAGRTVRSVLFLLMCLPMIGISHLILFFLLECFTRVCISSHPIEIVWCVPVRYCKCKNPRDRLGACRWYIGRSGDNCGRFGHQN